MIPMKIAIPEMILIKWSISCLMGDSPESTLVARAAILNIFVKLKFRMNTAKKNQTKIEQYHLAYIPIVNK